MSYQKLDIHLTMKGFLLAIIHKLFPENIPTVSEFAKNSGISRSTLDRGAEWLLKLLPKILRTRQPGPEGKKKEKADSKREKAFKQLSDLRQYIEEVRKNTPQNRCFDGETKKRITFCVEEIAQSRVLTYAEIAGILKIDERHLRRIRKEVEKTGGEAPEEKSRAPENINCLAQEIQRLIVAIKISAPTKRQYSATDIKRILEKSYKDTLLEYHKKPTITTDTVLKYMDLDEKEVWDHPRGNWNYPEPFQQAAIDTSYFKLFGKTYYLITALEAKGRVNLLTKVFLHDNKESVMTVLKSVLQKYRGIGVFVIDRGTPYLNDDVKHYLESCNCFRIICPPKTPTAKAFAERHFGALKPILKSAVETVFPKNPGWPHENMQKLLEVATAVFSSMYHQIPQEGIDGKSPAERIKEFDPVRACAEQMKLFERSLNSQPSTEYARFMHNYFQFPWDVKETVKELGEFPTKILRRLFAKVKPIMGPPIADSLHSPLKFLVARAWQIRNEETKEFFHKKGKEEEEKKKKEEELETQQSEREEPEKFVDGLFTTLIQCVQNNHVVKMATDYMRSNLRALYQKMDNQFFHEISRLKQMVKDLSDNETVRVRTEKILDDLVDEIASKGETVFDTS